MLTDTPILDSTVKKIVICATYSMEFEHPCALHKNYEVYHKRHSLARS